MNRSFNDFDEFGEVAREWRIETSLLGRGGFRADLLQVVDPVGEFHFVRTRMDGHIRQTGEPPHGMRTLCILASPELRVDWRRQPVDGNDILVFPSGGELEATTQPGFEIFIVSVTEELLARQLRTVSGRDTSESFFDSEVFHCDPDAMNRLRRRLIGYTDLLASGRPNRKAAAQFEDIAKDMVGAVVGKMVEPRPANRSRRHAAVRLAAAYLEQHAHEAPTVSHLCQLTGVSDRTLEYGFKELFGITPKLYTLALRLNGFRNALRNAVPATTAIADLANDWGFWHMGQLAADYRRMFGELPSTTLGRNSH